MEFKHLEIDREKGIIKIDGERIPKNATELNLHISGTDCRLEITLGYSGATRKWGDKSEISKLRMDEQKGE